LESRVFISKREKKIGLTSGVVDISPSTRKIIKEYNISFSGMLVAWLEAAATHMKV
jgi:hypothetical protein